jgi:uncharacterized protein
MKLTLQDATGQNVITGYGPGHVLINERRHESSLIVLPGSLVRDWPATFEELSLRHFESIVALAPEIVLLGTGSVLRFPEASLLRPLIAAGIGFEIMDLGAACRTYNILVAEGRKVAAALLMR